MTCEDSSAAPSALHYAQASSILLLFVCWLFLERDLWVCADNKEDNAQTKQQEPILDSHHYTWKIFTWRYSATILLKYVWPLCLCRTFPTLPPKTSLLKNRFTTYLPVNILLWCPRSSQLAWTLLTPLASPQAVPTLTLWNLPVSTTCISDCAPPSCPASEMLPTPRCLFIFQDLHQGSVSSRKTSKLLLVSCKMPRFCAPKHPLFAFILDSSQLPPAAWHFSGQES